MPGSWGGEIGGMLQGRGRAGRSLKRRPGLRMGCCADDDDDDDDGGLLSFCTYIYNSFVLLNHLHLTV